MRRIAVALVLLLAATVWPAVPGLANAPTITQAATVEGLQADFNNDGFADLAVGVVSENLAVGVSLEAVGAVADAGAVNVLYGTAGGLTGADSQLFTQDSPGVGSSAETEDNFGGVLAAGDFDGDRFADLAVGVWREDVGATANGGAVNVLYGTAGGLTGTGSQFLTQDSPGGARRRRAG